jgi:hypothetical protein
MKIQIRTKVYFPNLPIGTIGEEGELGYFFTGDKGKTYHWSHSEVESFQDFFEKFYLFTHQDILSIAVMANVNLSFSDISSYVESKK